MGPFLGHDHVEFLYVEAYFVPCPSPLFFLFSPGRDIGVTNSYFSIAPQGQLGRERLLFA